MWQVFYQIIIKIYPEQEFGKIYSATRIDVGHHPPALDPDFAGRDERADRNVEKRKSAVSDDPEDVTLGLPSWASSRLELCNEEKGGICSGTGQLHQTETTGA